MKSSKACTATPKVQNPAVSKILPPFQKLKGFVVALPNKIIKVAKPMQLTIFAATELQAYMANLPLAAKICPKTVYKP